MTLVLEQVSRRVGGETHIYPLDLELQPGSINVLLGRTVAGKTTLMRLMAGLDRPSTGRGLVDGQDVTGVSVRRRDVAMVYQQFINYPAFSVYDNIASPLRRAGVAKGEIDRRVGAIAEMLHIESLLQRLPLELSGGQQQRTALARALAKESSLLLLDEPLVNLDYKLREELRRELRAIFENRNSIVVYATTEPMEALMMGGNVLVVDVGRIVQAGPTIDVYNVPANERVGEVFSDPPINLIDGQVVDGAVVIGGDVRAPVSHHMAGIADGRYRFGVRAAHLFVTRQHVDDVEIDGTVELAEISGSETFVHFRHRDWVWVVQEEGVHEFELGAPMKAFMDPRHLFVFDTQGTLVAAPQRRTGSAVADTTQGVG